MQGVISSFRRGRKTQTMNQMIVHVDGVETKEKADKLVGKSVEWTAPGKDKKVLKGKIASAHGGKGAVRVVFETGVPGQALGQKVAIKA